MKVWCINPQGGGIKIPPNIYETILEQVRIHSSKRAWYPQYEIRLRFKNVFCYLDAVKEGKEVFPIGRMRYFAIDKWSLAFYTYSNERYQPCIMMNGEWFGTIGQAIDTCSVYLD